MAMRLDVEFPLPLTRDGKLGVTLAVAVLAKADRVRFVRGDRAAVVYGEALSAARLREALAEAGIAVEQVVSSLVEAEEAEVDDVHVPGAVAKERVRAIGR